MGIKLPIKTIEPPTEVPPISGPPESGFEKAAGVLVPPDNSDAHAHSQAILSSSKPFEGLGLQTQECLSNLIKEAVTEALGPEKKEYKKPAMGDPVTWYSMEKSLYHKSVGLVADIKLHDVDFDIPLPLFEEHGHSKKSEQEALIAVLKPQVKQKLLDSVDTIVASLVDKASGYED